MTAAAADDMHRRFEELIADTELDDLRQFGSRLGSAGTGDGQRQRLLRETPGEVALFRIRVDLDGCAPPIWRVLEVRSSITLDVLHQVLQVAFGWTDSHLHRFSLGGGPFEAHSELFLCPFDVAEGEDEGVAAARVRLDETLQDPGDVLHYGYDYGDRWELTLRLEQVASQAPTGAPVARCIDGDRAAPPEDSRGITDARSLAAVLPDPAHFDIAAVHRAPQDPYLVLRDLGVEEELFTLVGELRGTEPGAALMTRVRRLVDLAAVPPVPEDLPTSLAAFTWFLERAHGKGIELTSAGYLKPADVAAATPLVPAMWGWIGTHNREFHSRPLLEFRTMLQRIGLLRKRNGRLLLTRAGERARTDPERLWWHLAARLTGATDPFVEAASLLQLLYAATWHQDDPQPHATIAAALSELGWSAADRPLQQYDVSSLIPGPFDILSNVGTQVPGAREHAHLTADAILLARAALTLGALTHGAGL